MTSPCRAFIVLLAVAVALLAALGACSSGATCFRNTDCATGYGCQRGVCLRLSTSSSDAGDASSAEVNPDSSDAASQTPDAG